jgi:hypothetical protein
MRALSVIGTPGPLGDGELARARSGGADLAATIPDTHQ